METINQDGGVTMKRRNIKGPCIDINAWYEPKNCTNYEAFIMAKESAIQLLMEKVELIRSISFEEFEEFKGIKT